MKTETAIAILSDVSNFTLGIFGISIGVFTVLYAFVLSRKDSLVELSNLIKKGDAPVFLIQREAFYLNHIRRWKKINVHLKVISIISLVFYILSMAVRYGALIEYFCAETIKTTSIVLGVLAICLLVYIVVSLLLVFKIYNKTVKGL